MHTRMMLVAALLTATVVVSEEPPLMNGMPLLFEEDFDSGSDRWTMTDPKAWAVVDDEGRDVLALRSSSEYQPRVRSPHSIALIKDFDVGSFVFEAVVKQTGRSYGHRDLCIFFGHQSPSRFYYVHLASRADDRAHSIFLVNDAARVSVAQERTDGTDWDDQYHRVRVTRDVKSGVIEVFFDDMSKPVMRTVDKTFTSGTIGLGSFDDTANFDTVRIWAEPKGE